jgi:AraC family transcriptional regulator of adaptative response / DNA-3-methyladenine glycosylase II
VRLDADTCYRALRSRDARFDGLFFVGVRTTGIYCRPICPARVPARERCDFFGQTAEAERAGFRACFRCRPELAPGSAPVDSVPRLVRAAAARIDAGFLNEGSLDELAAELGVTARHLRRTFGSQLGVSPVEVAQTRRLALAKQLLHDTELPLADVAFASGFSSIRRFNSAFRGRFQRPPSGLRRGRGGGADTDAFALRLDYRPPLDWPALLAFLGVRALPGVEQVNEDRYERTARLGHCAGWIAVSRHPSRHALVAQVSLSLAPKLMELRARLRAVFDLDARPEVIAAHLRRDRRLRADVRAHPGLRVPGAFDPFELAVRAVLGQQISVAAARTLAGRLVARFGTPLGGSRAGLSALFPAASALAAVRVEALQALGLTSARAQTLKGLAEALASGRVNLSSGVEPERLVGLLQEVRGIGEWTAQYIALRALSWPDAFPAGDLGVHHALGVRSAREAKEVAEGWRPWRAYGVAHLWNRLTGGAT